MKKVSVLLYTIVCMYMHVEYQLLWTKPGPHSGSDNPDHLGYAVMRRIGHWDNHVRDGLVLLWHLQYLCINQKGHELLLHVLSVQYLPLFILSSCYNLIHFHNYCYLQIPIPKKGLL